VTAICNLYLWQIDFVLAFLNSESTFDIYMEQPRGFEEGKEVLYQLIPVTRIKPTVSVVSN